MGLLHASHDSWVPMATDISSGLKKCVESRTQLTLDDPKATLTRRGTFLRAWNQMPL